MADVLKEAVHTSTCARGADLLLNNVDATDLQRRSATGMLAGHSRGYLLVYEQIEGAVQFIIQVAFDATGMDKVAPEARDTRQQRHKSSFIRCDLRLQRPGNRHSDPVPLRGLFPKLLAARSCERVVLRTSIVLGGLPGRREPTCLFESMESGEQRTRLNDERAARDLFDPTRDAEAVQLRGGEGLEDQ